MRTLDEGFMDKALGLARKGLGATSPNPAVGAVIVKGGRIIGAGYHKKAGLAHAEVEALNSLRSVKAAAGADMYVTLEPCCHTGRTPPCTEALKRSGIRKVVIGLKDPNPVVSGRGVAALRKAGIEVVTGVLEDRCRRLNEPYIKHITTGAPFVVLKLAATLDGRSAVKTGESRWITGIESRRRVHGLRKTADAVMVGANTVIKDDPSLTVRHFKGRNPIRVVVDSAFSIPLTAKVLARADAPTLVFTTSRAEGSKVRKALSMGIEVVAVKRSKEGVDLEEALVELGKRGVTSLLVEGGSRLAASLIKGRHVDKLMVFIAPMLIGADGLPSIGLMGAVSLKQAVRLENVSCRKMGGDMLVEGYLDAAHARRGP